MTTQTNIPLMSLLSIHNTKYDSDLQAWGKKALLAKYNSNF